jgi:predicted metal-dependent hydrolase
MCLMKRNNVRRPIMIQQGKITLEGHDVPYTINKSYLAKYARLEIRSADMLMVTIPRRYKIAYVDQFIKRKSKWIIKTLAKHSCTQPTINFSNLSSGDTIPYLGRNIKLMLKPNKEKYIQMNIQEDCVLIGKRDDEIETAPFIEKWYRQQAHIVFKQKIEEFSRKLGIAYKRLCIRSQKTRWGSCSRLGTISLNWKLITLPEQIVDYVIIHELSHIKEMNHSRKFWALVADYCPQWQENRRWLRNHLL